MYIQYFLYFRLFLYSAKTIPCFKSDDLKLDDIVKIDDTFRSVQGRIECSLEEIIGKETLHIDINEIMQNPRFF